MSQEQKVQNDQQDVTPGGAGTKAGQTFGARRVGAEEAERTTLPEPSEHTTRHAVTVNGHRLTYDATVGTLNIDTRKVRPAASMFYAAFTVVDPSTGKSDFARPVTFVFNGGPGSSTAFLLLGSIAPRRIATPDAAPVPAAPYRLIDNPQTLLPDSDLVFIDAPGTGFSTLLDAAKPELWSVDGDVAAFSVFIRQYLSAHGRWNSPKYVLGESYGTTRGAALAYRLQQDGVALNGIVLLSNILDYAYASATSDQYYVGYFPTYASVAQYHHMAGRGLSQTEHLRRARAFANGPLRLALAHGDSLSRDARAEIARRYAELTGLPASYVEASDLRVLDARFRKQLLRGQGKIVGRYDGRIAGYDLDSESDDETFAVDEAFLDPAYGSLASTYLRDELGWRATAERRRFAGFDWNSMEPGKGWQWHHELPEHAKISWGRNIPFPQVTADLAAAIVRQPTFKVLIGNGLFDLCTPFSQTEYDIDHLGLPPALRGNIAFTYYQAGHMVYTSEVALTKFRADLEAFYKTDAAGMPAIDERRS